MQFFVVIFIVIYHTISITLASFTSTKIKTEMMPKDLNVENYDSGITGNSCFKFFLTKQGDGAGTSNTLTINV